MSPSPSLFKFSLRAFQQHWVWLSLGLLLINDHVLKAAVPSWLTGKLSDGAGLFFFPFLLLAVLAGPLGVLRVRPRAALAVVVGLTALSFSLIKTVPAANALVAQGVGALWGHPVQIVLDPWDLRALPVLALTWRLGCRVEHMAPQAQPVGRRAYGVLAVAALATLATTPCMPPSRVMRVVAHEGVFYAGLAQFNDTTPEWGYQSTDGGLSWQWVAPGAEQPPASAQAPNGLTPVCLTTTPQHCYRLPGAEATVEETLDGGQHWQVAWQIPAGRRLFMARNLAGCKVAVDPGPYDLAVVETGEEHTVLVAMGNEGVLRRAPTGEWQRLPLVDTGPTPYAPPALAEAWDYISAELFGTGLLTLLTLASLFTEVWRTVLQARNAQTGWTGWPTVGAWIYSGLICLVGVTGLVSVGEPRYAGWRVFEGLLSGAYQMTRLGWLVGWPYVTFGLALVVMGLGVSWWRVSQHAARRPLVLAFVSCLLTAAGVASTGLYYLLWVLDVLPAYELALGLAALTLWLVVRYGTQRVKHYSQLASAPPTQA